MWLALLAISAHAADPVHARMATHLTLAEEARAAVIAGELEAAVARGKALQGLSSDGLPETWAPYLADLQQGARELASAQSLATAAASTSQLVQACASCHQALKGGPSLTGPSAPRPTWDDDDPMPRHRWAAEWLFLGLLATDEAAFQRGAAALAAGPFLVDPAASEAVSTARDTVVSVAGRLQKSSAEGDRVRLVGELLGACGACHAATASGPVEGG